MVRIAAPAQMCQVISQMAVTKARQDIQGRGWKSSGSIQPSTGQGQVGLRSTVRYLMYQNKGFDPFVMFWVNGRMVGPMKSPDGKSRMVRGKEAGMPGFVNIPGRGKVWRDQKWKHPGLKPKRFMETAIRDSIKENKDYIKRELNSIMRGE